MRTSDDCVRTASSAWGGKKNNWEKAMAEEWTYSDQLDFRQADRHLYILAPVHMTAFFPN